MLFSFRASGRVPYWSQLLRIQPHDVGFYFCLLQRLIVGSNLFYYYWIGDPARFQWILLDTPGGCDMPWAELCKVSETRACIPCFISGAIHPLQMTRPLIKLAAWVISALPNLPQGGAYMSHQTNSAQMSVSLFALIV